MAVLIGLLAGTAAAAFRGTLVDNAVMVVAMIAVSTPGFWFGIMPIFLFAVTLGWFPSRAKGFNERVMSYRHVLRNSLIPVVSIIGLQFGDLLAGTVIIEQVFARQVWELSWLARCSLGITPWCRA